MAGATILLGASSERYRFEVHGFSTRGLAGVQGVYAVSLRYSKPDGGVAQRLLYIGESGNLGSDLLSHPRMKCLQDNRANCILLHEDTNARSRREKLDDLLNKYRARCND